jgi:FlaA1/EpsC-like NDP-sugar epimerase
MKNIIRRFSWVVLDVVFINVSLILSLILRFGEGWGTYFYVYRELIIYLTGFFLLFAVVFRLYKRIWDI